MELFTERARYFITPSIQEILEAFSSLTFYDTAALVTVVFWCVLLVLPMPGVDRRDSVAAFTYIGVTMACGVVLSLAAPRFLTSPRDVMKHLLVLAGFAVASGIRWSSAKHPVKTARDLIRDTSGRDEEPRDDEIRAKKPQRERTSA